MESVAISVRNISKCYCIYDSPRDRLKQFILPRFQRLIGVKKDYFREFWSLQDISFDIKRGETVGIVGKNGSGKSTLLQIICGTLNPTSGEVATNGRIAALLELGSGFNPDFTGRENVYMNASILGLRNDEIDARFSKIVDFADIGDFIDQPVKTYSSGMMVRLAFSVIAHVDADILIIDEALSVGDAFFTQKCMRFLRDFMEKGTVLFVSHDTGAVVNLCNKAILLDHGKIVRKDTPKKVIREYLGKLNQSKQQVFDDEVHDIEEGVSVIKDDYIDMRQALFNSSTLRNDIEIFKFNSQQESFGTGQADIISVNIFDEGGMPLSWVVGGENIILQIVCKAYKRIIRPIIGFQFKDRLGQVLFCDNTFITYENEELIAEAGSKLVANFEFRLPVLPTGDYSISPAIAEGTQKEHIQHQWIHDALIVKVHASSACLGLIGLPMRKITISIDD